MSDNLSDFMILAIVTAYEQGVGKGQDSIKRGLETTNPYTKDTSYFKAWNLGYEEGRCQMENVRPEEPLVEITSIDKLYVLPPASMV